jgi:hypothetical protein
MKNRANWLLIPTVALGLGACKKNETVQSPAAPEAPAAEVETPPAVVPVPPSEPATPKVGAEERAAKLGFAKHLPQETEVVVSIYNGSQSVERVKSSRLWKLVQNQLAIGMGPGMEMDDFEFQEGEQDEPIHEEGAPNPGIGGDLVEDGEPIDPAAMPDFADPGEAAGPGVLFGSEFTLALGKSSAVQGANLLTLNRRLSYFQMRGVARAMAAAMSTGDSSGLLESVTESYTEDTLKDLIKDPESGVGLLEKAQMPPLYLAFLTTEADRPMAAQQVAAMVENLNDLGDVAAPLKFETAGVAFEGAQIVGSKISALMAEDREEMDLEIGAEMTDKVLAAIAKKDLVVVSGVVGDYVLMFIGSSADDLKLAEDLSQSLVGSEALSFSDGYLSKDLAALVYGQKESLETLFKAAGGIADMTNGLRDGFAASESLGDTRDLEAMFQIVAEREAALRKLAGIESAGTIAYFEDGLKVEGYGGTDSGMIDWKASNRLAHLGDSEDVFMFANLTADAVYDEKARAYGEALLETAYAMAMKVADVPGGEAEVAQFKEAAKTFDAKFRPDLTALWDAYGNDFQGSLGHERALVVDLKGTAPAVPGVPQAVVDTARVPRISFIAPVTDRVKLAGSWDKMNTTLTGTLAKISEMMGEDMPMQKPLSSEKNGTVTWFFPMPFFTDDFLPSVTVNDNWFVTSTSKMQAQDLIDQANAPTEGRSGFWFSMNFKTLQKYADETYQVIDANSEALMGQPLLPEQQKLIKDSIEILSDLDKLTVHSRREGAVLRSSVHFKTR